MPAGSPAGYSGVPLARKLGVRAGDRLCLLDAPPGWSVPALPPDVELTSRWPGKVDRADVILVFVRAAAELAPAVTLARSVYPDGALWVAWPRRAGGHQSDVTENGVRDAALPLGLVDVKVAALDADWSGLRLVWRKELRREPHPSWVS